MYDTNKKKHKTNKYIHTYQTLALAGTQDKLLCVTKDCGGRGAEKESKLR